MTLTQLNYIVALDRHKNFVQAAEACNVTQPTLSQQIQKLEEELGVQLFDRSQQPIRLTPIGEHIVAQARIVLRESERIQDLVAEDKGEVGGEVRLGVIPTLAPYLLPCFAGDLLKKHKNLTLKIEEKTTSQIVSDLEDGLLDVGILSTPLADSNIKRSILFYEPFLIYASKSHHLLSKKRVDEKELSVVDALLLNEGHCLREQALTLCRSRKDKDIMDSRLQFESGSLETLLGVVDQGGGYTFLPYLAKEHVKNQDQIREFVTPVPTREVSLVYSPHYRRDSLKKALIEAIQAGIPQEIQKLKKDSFANINIKIKTNS